MAGGIYKYLRGRLFGNLGTGADAMGFEQPTTLPMYDGWMRPRYAVRGQLDTQRPGYVKYDQQFVPVDLVGNGIAIQGQLALQALSQVTGGSD